MVRLLSLSLLLNITLGVSADSFTAVKSGSWSDPATWGTRQGEADNQPPLTPGPRDHVFIAANTRVVFDGKAAGAKGSGEPGMVRVASVSVQRGAVLTCPRSPLPFSIVVLELALLRIEGGGCFSCGHGDCKSNPEPYAGTFVLRLRSDRSPQSADDNVRTLLVEDGGALFLSGMPRGQPVARLDGDAHVGATRWIISADDGAGIFGGRGSGLQSYWKPGDRVAIAPTDFDPTQTEYHTIVELSSTVVAQDKAAYTIEVADALKYARSGRVFSLTNRADGNRVVKLDARAEIVLLSRNVVIEGTDDAIDGLGGDLKIVGPRVRAHLSWVEIRRMGRRGHLGRYPLHIHNVGDGGRNVLVSNVAIHSSYQRGVVVHCTNNVRLVNNTVVGTFGHGYMLEDGAEEGNELIGNYAIDIRPAGTGIYKPLIQTERVNPAGFWFVNAANIWQRNVAAGVSGAGFSLDMDAVLGDRPASLTTCPDALPRVEAVGSWWKVANHGDVTTATTAALNRAVNTALMRKRFVKFEDNTAHATFSGLWMTYPFFDMDDMMATSQPGAQNDVFGFTAWKIGFRPYAMDDLTDGVKLIFEACVHVRNLRRVRFHRLTCLNAQRVAWSALAATFDGTTMGWLSDQELTPSGTFHRPSVPTAAGAMLSYLEPHTFARTHVVGDASRLTFATAFKGQRMAPLNVLHGLSVDPPQPTLAAAVESAPRFATAAAASTAGATRLAVEPLIGLSAGDCHVYMDETGDAFGAGPDAVVAASCPGCPGVDPLVEAHAQGRCAAAAARAPVHSSSSPDEARGVLPSGAVVAAKGGTVPVLCYGGSESLNATAVRFIVLDVAFFGVGGTRPMRALSAEAVGLAGPIRASRRVVDAFPMLLPLTPSSMAPQGGGYRLEILGGGVGDAPALDYVDIALGSTTRPDDAMTLVLAGIDATATAEPGYGSIWSSMNVETKSHAACASTASQLGAPISCAIDDVSSSSTLPNASLPRVCICRAADGGELVMRFSAGREPQYRGIYAPDGSPRPTHSLGSVRVSFF